MTTPAVYNNGCRQLAKRGCQRIGALVHTFRAEDMTPWYISTLVYITTYVVKLLDQVSWQSSFSYN